MSREFFEKLPSEIIINILSRLPVRTVISCKCVCRSWLYLLETPEFAKSHLCKSVPGLVVFRSNTMRSHLFSIFEFEDTLELEKHELHYNRVVEFDQRAFITLPHGFIGIQGSANGLLFLREINTQPNALWICNPITREYIELPNPEGMPFHHPTKLTYGFGVCETSGEYKVVRIMHECVRDPGTHALLSIPKSECKVYTLGTSTWRSIPPGDTFEYNSRSIGVFLNGYLHWLVSDLKGCLLISCLNLETEVFTRISTPPGLPESRRFLGGIVVLEDCLCLCDNSSGDEIVIWMMKEDCWRKEYVIRKHVDMAGPCYEVVYPLKVFRDGDILMTWDDFYLFYYCHKNCSSTTEIGMLELQGTHGIQAMLHTSSFVSLKSFVMENVSSF